MLPAVETWVESRQKVTASKVDDKRKSKSSQNRLKAEANYSRKALMAHEYDDDEEGGFDTAVANRPLPTCMKGSSQHKRVSLHDNLSEDEDLQPPSRSSRRRKRAAHSKRRVGEVTMSAAADVRRKLAWAAVFVLVAFSFLGFAAALTGSGTHSSNGHRSDSAAAAIARQGPSPPAAILASVVILPPSPPSPPPSPLPSPAPSSPPTLSDQTQASSPSPLPLHVALPPSSSPPPPQSPVAAPSLPPPGSLLPPRLLPPYPPPPSATEPLTWEEHPGRNCWWDGNGAGLELETPRGSSAPDVNSLEGCKAACVAKRPECEGFLLTERLQCYRKGELTLDSCGYSSDMVLYLIVPPSPPSPPSPPPSPPYLPFSGGVNAINDRFRYGRPSDTLEHAGLLLHQWDGLEAHDVGKPWQMCIVNCMCQGSFIMGRVSAMAVYRDLNRRQDRVAIPLPFGNRGGLILHPSYVTSDCSYGIDGATYHLDNPDHPGCTDTFCDAESRFDYEHNAHFFCSFGGGYVEAWGPQDLKIMLETHATHGAPYRSPGFHSGYNEIIINSPKLNEQLPQAIMGFFFPKGQSPVTSDLGYGIMIDVVKVHAAFLEEYGLTDEQVPLLVLDPSNWEAPFSPYHP